MSRKGLFITIGIIVALIVAILITSAISKRKVNFTITSTPEKILIYIDNQKYETPLTIKRSPGTYTIWGLKEGYAPYKEDFQIKKGQDATLNIILEKEQEPPEGAP